MKIIKRVEYCDYPSCNHADGWLYMVGIFAFGHWIDITRDGNKFNIRVDEDSSKIIMGLTFEKAQQIFTIIMSHYARV